MNHFNKKVIPPVYFLITLFLMIGMHKTMPVIQLITQPYSWSGAVLIVLGFFALVSSAMLFSRADTPLKPFEETTSLVRGGLYKVTRNPMYLGMAMVLTGTAIGLGSLGAFLFIPLFVWLIQSLFIVQEERILEEQFGDEYRQFKLSVRRWL